MQMLLEFAVGCFGWSEKLFQKRNKEVKNKLNNKLININKAKPKDNSNNEQVKNVYFYRFAVLLLASLHAEICSEWRRSTCV